MAEPLADPQLTPEEDIAAQAFGDPVFFCHFFLEEWFPDEIPWVHRGIFAILCQQTDFLWKYGELEKIEANFVWAENPEDEQSPTHPIFEIDYDTKTITINLTKFTLMMLPRGFSKTTVANAVMLYWIHYQLHKYALYVSETASHSEDQLGNVKRQLEINDRFHTVFGNLCPGRQDVEKWTAEFIETVTGIKVAARGRGGQVRGLLKDGQRPDVILVDDLENKESVSTAEQRKKVRSWAYNDLMPVLPRRDPKATILAMGTLLHSEALLTTWAKDPRFTTVIFGAEDRDGDLLWADHMGTEEIASEKEAFALAGELPGFYMEFYNKVRSEETAKFRSEFFIHRPVDPEKFPYRSLVIDPAISEKASADFCAFAVAAMSEQGQIALLESYGKRGMLPREQIDTYFDFYAKWRPQQCGVESVAYQAALVHLLREEMFRKKMYFEIIPITHTNKKTERVEGILQPRYANGYIIHARRFAQLETQLLDWPNGKKDYPDAAAMAVALLDIYAPAAGMGEGQDLADSDYEDLDDVFEGDWRQY